MREFVICTQHSSASIMTLACSQKIHSYTFLALLSVSSTSNSLERRSPPARHLGELRERFTQCRQEGGRCDAIGCVCHVRIETAERRGQAPRSISIKRTKKHMVSKGAWRTEGGCTFRERFAIREWHAWPGEWRSYSTCCPGSGVQQEEQAASPKGIRDDRTPEGSIKLTACARVESSMSALPCVGIPHIVPLRLMRTHLLRIEWEWMEVLEVPPQHR